MIKGGCKKKASAVYDSYSLINSDPLMLRLLFGRWCCDVVRSTSATSQNFDQLTRWEVTYRPYLPHVQHSSRWTAANSTFDLNTSTKIRKVTKIMGYIRLLPQYSHGLYEAVGRQLVSGVSVQPTTPIFRAQAVRKCLTCVTSQKSEEFSKN